MRIPERPPSKSALMTGPAGRDFANILQRVSSPTHKDKYLHWDEIRRRSPPAGLTHEKWWLGLKVQRNSIRKSIPLRDARGNSTGFTTPELVQALLHEITQRASGTLGASDQVTNPETRDHYLIRNLMEEGITSSLIEGASTTREKAKAMLRSNRRPRDHGEQMVLNNYAAMRYIIDLGRVPLTHEVVFRLHEMITNNTLDDPTAAGRFRRSDEPVDVADMYNNVLHDPPQADQLPDRLEAMCAFANGKTPGGFVHPVVRSILLHYWLAYDHPFKDGNGRTARALYYWSMLQHDYWLCQFISISQIILKAPSQYARAFLYSETDENDLTYFLLHQLDVTKKAMDALHAYIDGKLAQRRQLERRLRLASSLNDRQLDLIGHTLRHPNAEYDIRQHQATHRVAYETARTDLMELEAKGLLKRRKRGRMFLFYPAPSVQQQLETL